MGGGRERAAHCGRIRLGLLRQRSGHLGQQQHEGASFLPTMPRLIPFMHDISLFTYATQHGAVVPAQDMVSHSTTMFLCGKSVMGIPIHYFLFLLLFPLLRS